MSHAPQLLLQQRFSKAFLLSIFLLPFLGGSAEAPLKSAPAL
jgi:hypothetical protein